MLENAWFRFGLFLIFVGVCVAQAIPAKSDAPQPHGDKLVAEYRLPLEAIERYADMAAARAGNEPRREGSKFADALPWIGPHQVVGFGRNPYTLVFTVHGVARSAGEVSAHWQSGWEIQESEGATREVMIEVPVLEAKAVRAQQPVVLTLASDRVSFRGERVVAPKFGLVQMRNLEIHDVRVQVWSGSAPLTWPKLHISSLLLLVLGAAALLMGLLRGSASDEGEADAQWEPTERCNLIELPTTSSELAAIPSPAAHGGSAPISARGTHIAL
jgi:hypothetical protein